MTNEEIAIRIQQGEVDLLPELWEQMHGLICWHVNRFCAQYSERCISSGVTSDDLIQTGYFALLDAVKAYNLDGEYKFTAYLNYPIKNRFKAAVGKRCNAKINPLDCCTSLDAPTVDGCTVMDTVPDIRTDIEDCERSVYIEQLHDALEEGMDNLPEDLHEVVRRRFYAGETTKAIGEDMSVPAERVRQMESNGLRKLRNPRIRNRLAPFMYAEITEQEAYRNSGYTSFRHSQMSSVERALERIERYMMG